MPLFDNEKYIVLGGRNANKTSKPCGQHIIALFNSVRDAAGAMRERENLKLVQYLDEVPEVSKKNIEYIGRPIFNEQLTIKLDVITRRINGPAVINPFEKSTDVHATMYGPTQVALHFDSKGHTLHHGKLKQSVRALLMSKNDKPFINLNTVVQGIIFSQFCDGCLIELLSSLKRVDDVLKFVDVVSRGMWSPKDKLDMKMCYTWIDNKGNTYPSVCWRLKPLPKLRPQQTVTQSTADEYVSSYSRRVLLSTTRPLSPENICDLTPQWKTDALRQTLKDLKIKETALQEELNDRKNEQTKKQMKSLKAQKISILRRLLELENIDIGKIGFNFGLPKLNEGLERAVSIILNELNIRLDYDEIIRRLLPVCEKMFDLFDCSDVEETLMDFIIKRMESVFNEISGKGNTGSNEPNVFSRSVKTSTSLSKRNAPVIELDTSSDESDSALSLIVWSSDSEQKEYQEEEGKEEEEENKELESDGEDQRTETRMSQRKRKAPVWDTDDFSNEGSIAPIPIFLSSDSEQEEYEEEEESEEEEAVGKEQEEEILEPTSDPSSSTPF